jgi:hypothetical protein
VGLGGEVMRLGQGAYVACSGQGRPRVVVQTVPSGPGVITVNVGVTDNPTTPNNELQSISFVRIVNAQVTAGSRVNQQAPFSVSYPTGTRTTSFTVRRAQPGAMHVDFRVSDTCGPWQTMVGAGPSVP